MGQVAAALAKGKTNGFVKLLVSNDSQMRLLGIRCGGVQAESLIEICSYLIRSGRSVGELKVRGLLLLFPLGFLLFACVIVPHVMLSTGSADGIPGGERGIAGGCASVVRRVYLQALYLSGYDPIRKRDVGRTKRFPRSSVAAVITKHPFT